MCWADVPRVSNRFRLHLCFAGAGDDFLLRAGQFHQAQSTHSRSRREISRAERAFDGVSCVWDCMDFWRDRTDKSPANRGRTRESSDRSQRSTVRHGAGLGGPRFQDRRGAVPTLGAGCLPRGAYTGDRISFRRVQGCRIRRAASGLAAIPCTASNAATDCSDRAADFDLWKSCGSAADKPEATPCLFEHRTRRIFADRCGMFRCYSRGLLSRCLSAHDTS